MVQPPNRTVVVGVDGSPTSERALHWAIGQAQSTGAELRPVLVWRWLGLNPYMPPVPPSEIADEASSVLADVLSRVTPGESGLPIDPRVLEGHPAEVLVEQARQASLLVLGNRGHSELAGMLLGSVSAYCVAHAPCPVVVVP